MLSNLTQMKGILTWNQFPPLLAYISNPLHFSILLTLVKLYYLEQILQFMISRWALLVFVKIVQFLKEYWQILINKFDITHFGRLIIYLCLNAISIVSHDNSIKSIYSKEKNNKNHIIHNKL